MQLNEEYQDVQQQYQELIRPLLSVLSTQDLIECLDVAHDVKLEIMQDRDDLHEELSVAHEANIALAQDARRYTLLKYTLGHMFSIIAYAGRHDRELYEKLLNLSPEALDESLDARIEAGDLAELLDAIEADKVAALEAEQPL